MHDRDTPLPFPVRGRPTVSRHLCFVPRMSTCRRFDKNSLLTVMAKGKQLGILFIGTFREGDATYRSIGSSTGHCILTFFLVSD